MVWLASLVHHPHIHQSSLHHHHHHHPSASTSSLVLHLPFSTILLHIHFTSFISPSRYIEYLVVHSPQLHLSPWSTRTATYTAQHRTASRRSVRGYEDTGQQATALHRTPLFAVPRPSSTPHPALRAHLLLLLSSSSSTQRLALHSSSFTSPAVLSCRLRNGSCINIHRWRCVHGLLGVSLRRGLNGELTCSFLPLFPSPTLSFLLLGSRQDEVDQEGVKDHYREVLPTVSNPIHISA
jgi:hypothetical protein